MRSRFHHLRQQRGFLEKHGRMKTDKIRIKPKRSEMANKINLNVP